MKNKNSQPYGLPSPPGVGTSPMQLPLHTLPFQGRLFRYLKFCFYFLLCCHFKICRHNFPRCHIDTQASPEQPQLTERWQLQLTERSRCSDKFVIIETNAGKSIFSRQLKIDLGQQIQLNKFVFIKSNELKILSMQS